MKKVIINGRWNKPIEYEWKGDLITTLREMNDWTMEEDNPGYFFEIEDADPNYIKTMSLPIFMNEYGVLLAPTDYTIEESENKGE